MDKYLFSIYCPDCEEEVKAYADIELTSRSKGYSSYSEKIVCTECGGVIETSGFELENY